MLNYANSQIAIILLEIINIEMLFFRGFETPEMNPLFMTP